MVPSLARILEKSRKEVGYTGLAQVSGRNDLSWDEKFALDVWYVDHCSAWLDVKILARTVRVVLGGEGVSAPLHATAPDFLGTMGNPVVREQRQIP